MNDRRAFYLFTPERELDYEALQRVTIVRPGGNDTAIVWDPVRRAQQGEVAGAIQTTYPGVEQVMFVERIPGTLRLRGQMAGGEFCGNATRSLGYLLLDGKDGTVDLDVSGASKPMTVTVKEGGAQTEIPVLSDLGSVQNRPDGEKIVDLEGISFLVTRADQPTGQALMALPDEVSRKERVKQILKEVELIDKPASGVMVVSSRPDGKLGLDPFVYVRDTGTLYYETGCGSGSTAVGLVQAAGTGASVPALEIVQPSGLPLIVSVDRGESSFRRAFVNGPIEVLFDGRMYLPRQAVEKKAALTL